MKKMGEVTENISSGKSKSKNAEGMYPFYGSTGIIAYANEFDYSGDKILIARVGANAGSLYKVNGKYSVSDNALILNLNNEVDLNFIYNYLTKNSLNKLIFGSGQPLITGLQLKLLKISVPKFLEQQKISCFLSLIDERISTQNKIIEHLKTLIRGLREKLFRQQLRFKNENGNNFPNWEMKKLGEVCEKKSSSISANKIESNFGEYIIYGASGILKKVDFYEEENDYISIVKDGAGVGRLFYCKGKSSVLGTMDIIKPQTKINTYFLLYLLKCIDFKTYITGSTIPHIYFKDYKNENCVIPCTEEQLKISNLLSSIGEKIETEKELLRQYNNQKKHLLQDLFI